MRATVVIPVLLASVAADLCRPGTARAQEPSSTIIVVVRSAGTGGALRGAQVAVEGLGTGGVANEAGVVRLIVPPGSHTVGVRYTGFETVRQAVRIGAGETRRLSAELTMRAVALPEVRARARPGIRYLASRGFYARKENGPGRFFTREDIERQKPARLSEMLRTTPGIRLSATRFSDSRATSGRSVGSGARCPIQYFVDGVPAMGLNIDDVPARDVEGMEVYSGASQIPPEFNRRTALCGVIVIWTRVD